MSKRISINQFRSTRCYLPWVLHCLVWGIDKDKYPNPNPNIRVFSYVNGLYIVENQNMTYSTSVGNKTIQGDDLYNVETLFYDTLVSEGNL